MASTPISDTTGLSFEDGVNLALVFVKPHACNPKVVEFVETFLSEHDCVVVKKGERTGVEMEHFIDEHYTVLHEPAMLKQPDELEVSQKKKEKFKETFGEDWDTVVKEDRVYNAKKFTHLYDPNEVCVHWEGEKAQKTAVAPGTVVGLLQGHESGEKRQYVINGFYMDMRAKFMEKNAKVYTFLVEFREEKLSWKEFRLNVVGKTDPEKAKPGSLRNEILNRYKELDLPSRPNYGDNGVHASAGPIEALRERLIWYNWKLEDDPLVKNLLKKDVDLDTVQQMLKNVVVELDGRKSSVFDLTEDDNTSEGIRKVVSVRMPLLKAFSRT